MTIVVFGGYSGVGHAIIKEFNDCEKFEIINVDMVPSPIANFNLIGDISCPDFIAKGTQYLSNLDQISAIIWSIRYRNSDSISDLDLVKATFNAEIFPLISIVSSISELIIRDSPSVVILSSIASQFISSQHYAYNLVKSAIDSYVRAMAVKYGDISHARFNAISPGIIDIPGRSGSFNNDNSSLQSLRKSSVPRLSTIHVAEIAKLCFFLTSSNSSALNGTVLMADGGESILDQYFVAQRTFNSIS